MLFGINTALAARIASGQVDEASLYADARQYRLARPARTRPGVLHCPICGTSASRFLRFGFAGRRNARCPCCGSLERHRFLWLYLAAIGAAVPGARVLHTAAEPFLEQRLRPRIGRGYLTVDRYDPNADLAADLADLPMPSGAFDVVLSCHVLEHMADDRPALAELGRVLRPGGTLILMVPMTGDGETRQAPPAMGPFQRLMDFGHPFHHRLYGFDLLERLDALGIDGRVIASKRWLSPHRRRRFRINKTWLIHGTKRR